MKSHPTGRSTPHARVAPSSRQIDTRALRPVEFRVRPLATTRCTIITVEFTDRSDGKLDWALQHSRGAQRQASQVADVVGGYVQVDEAAAGDQGV